MIRRNLLVALFLMLVLVPSGIALWRIDTTRHLMVRGPQADYLRHLVPPAGMDAAYTALGFRLTDVRNGAPVPRVYFASVPGALPDLRSAADRKGLFLATLLPLVLRVNELIAADRAHLMALKRRQDAGRPLAPLDRAWLATLAQRYRLNNGDDGENGENGADIAALLHRVDTIPPSLALAQAAIESGWGTSHFARAGNALFGEWVWGDNARGIIPRGRPEGANYKVRSFDYLMQSVARYASNLNRHRSYADFRRRRAEQRAAGDTPDGLTLAETLSYYSTRREAYVIELKSIIIANRLDVFDRAVLAPGA